MNVPFRKNILLLGAGFSANFGAPLARDMWSKLLNNSHLKDLPAIKELLLKNFDYESVYAQVHGSSNFSQTERDALGLAMVESYKEIDDTISHYVYSGFNGRGSYWSHVNGFTHSFNGAIAATGIGAVFTLNQDLLFERAGNLIPLFIKPVYYTDYWNKYFAKARDLSNNIVLPDKELLEKIKEAEYQELRQRSTSLVYIKLHGSYGWTSHDGNHKMVIGNNKSEQIKKEPLLNWYFQLFEESLYKNESILWVVGYSFRDAHVNDIILNAIEKFGLRIKIISPEDPETLMKRLQFEDVRNLMSPPSKYFKIWGAVDAYYRKTMSELFPENQSMSVEGKQILEILSKE